MLRLNLTTLLFAFILGFFQSFSQTSAENPVEHMSYFTDREEMLSKKYLSYMSEVAHGGKARKMEKRRAELLTAIKEAQRDANKLRPYKGDASLRDAFKEYWSVLLSIFNEDYHKIVDMEEIAEQSYDAMEAYLLTQEKANEKLDEAYEKVSAVYNAFAATHNVRLIESQGSKLNKRLAQVGKVNSYTNQIYLIFFKSTVQETVMMEAQKTKDVNGIEQSKNSMLKYANEGLTRLDTIKPFKNDGSLITACRKVLEFQKSEAEKVSYFSNFFLKHDEFEKLKKSFESKPANLRTKADMDAFNNAVNDYNKAVNEYNKVSSELNTNRAKVMNNWNVTRKRFMEMHVPHSV